MAEQRTFTLEEIKAAFWKEFHESGERWFPYSEDDKESNQDITETVWRDFLEYLGASE